MKHVLDRSEAVSLIFSRAVYAINWFNVAAVFAFMASDFHQNVSGLGVVTASFYVGLGVFQIPGGIAAAKFGPRRIAIIGMLTSSFAAFLCAFAAGFYQLVVLRFFVGVGMAFFFGPGVTLIVKAFRKGSQGFGVGLFNASFYIGGALGLFGWSILTDFAGWRWGLGVSGALGIVGGLLLIRGVPSDELRRGFVVRVEDLKKILSNRWLLALSLELFGIGSGQILVNTFMIFYLEQSFKLAPTIAGVIGSLSPLSAILASPFFGMLYDRTKKVRLLLFLLGAALASAIALVAIGTVYSAIVASVITGCCAAAFTISYLAAREIPAVSAEYETLAVSWVNCIQMVSGFWSPVAFSLIVISLGYATSWLIGAAYTFVLTSVILFARNRP